MHCDCVPYGPDVGTREGRREMELLLGQRAQNLLGKASHLSSVLLLLVTEDQVHACPSPSLGPAPATRAVRPPTTPFASNVSISAGRNPSSVSTEPVSAPRAGAGRGAGDPPPPTNRYGGRGAVTISPARSPAGKVSSDPAALTWGSSNTSL